MGPKTTPSWISQGGMCGTELRVKNINLDIKQSTIKILDLINAITTNQQILDISEIIKLT